jgi:hypothetical protein
MTIIVEDGTGLANAVSYISVTDADAYHLSMAATLWANMTDPEKESCLIRATNYMVQKYRLRWKGQRYVATQRLDWPRYGVVISDNYATTEVSNDTVPEEVKNACAELALRASIGTLSEDLSPRVTQETIGPITVKYDAYSSAAGFVQVEDTLKPYMSFSGGAMVRLSRC